MYGPLYWQVYDDKEPLHKNDKVWMELWKNLVAKCALCCVYEEEKEDIITHEHSNPEERGDFAAKEED